MSHIKPVVLYDRQRVRPQTILALAECKPGALIPVERSELEAFQSILVHVPDDHPGLPELRAQLRQDAKEKRRAEKEEGEGEGAGEEA